MAAGLLDRVCELFLRPSLRTRSLLSQDSPQFLFEPCQKRFLSQRPAGPFVRSKELYVLLSNHPREKTAPFRGQLKQRSDRGELVIAATDMGCGAAPSIPPWRLRQPRAPG